MYDVTDFVAANAFPEQKRVKERKKGKESLSNKLTCHDCFLVKIIFSQKYLVWNNIGNWMIFDSRETIFVYFWHYDWLDIGWSTG